MPTCFKTVNTLWVEPIYSINVQKDFVTIVYRSNRISSYLLLCTYLLLTKYHDRISILSNITLRTANNILIAFIIQKHLFYGKLFAHMRHACAQSYNTQTQTYTHTKFSEAIFRKPGIDQKSQHKLLEQLRQLTLTLCTHAS